jgi:ATP-dependent Clp protease adaptor protein ClpS
MIRAVNEDKKPELGDFGNKSAFLNKRHPATAGDKDDKENGGSGGTGTDVITKPKTRTKKPRLYKVLLLNDDYTPMDFVIFILEQYFNKSRSEATGIMLQVHQRGVGICGVFTYEVAETKVSQVMNIARQNEHPLQCTMEKE